MKTLSKSSTRCRTGRSPTAWAASAEIQGSATASAPRTQCSDDLIEVEGDVRGCDEFNGTEGIVVLQPSGDRFLVNYGINGPVWDVAHEHVSGHLQVSIESGPSSPSTCTDTATVTGDIQSVSFWKKWPPSSEEIGERVERYMENRRLDDETIRRVWNALGCP